MTSKDNVFISYKVLHYSGQRRKGKRGSTSIKFDISKAYDWVEWYFLKAIIQKMGFSEKWIQMVMFCVKSVLFSILINGELKGLITPSRGVSEGDPLSPYLFLLCNEWLTFMLSYATSTNHITGIQICKNAPKTNHLLFKDDSILFLLSRFRGE